MAFLVIRWRRVGGGEKDLDGGVDDDGGGDGAVASKVEARSPVQGEDKEAAGGPHRKQREGVHGGGDEEVKTAPVVVGAGHTLVVVLVAADVFRAEILGVHDTCHCVCLF
ncbi:hypothetical protein F442_06320 [Phytophthora nicotianae P10297]|uniref:Uncharacterized protein n=3 Tax=Phytophthora nicotianae TaxID=4792 RepID=V9FI66_PHYNI|nr:hypothetical protein F443_06279 [Phytophthora nicotianae P1569]ETK89983.1 hypothetical protein L915_06153 [Phytophthora nicotianae]ETP47802.1 hypothetical protein F442_06320 [Phytophthora nicotianae P10297]